MMDDIVKCDKCGAYNDIAGLNDVRYSQQNKHFDPDEAMSVMTVICEKCGERIEI